MRQGSRHTEQSRQAISAAKMGRKRLTADESMAADLRALRLIGPATKFSFAERTGDTEWMAARRLKRLSDERFAERYKLPGMVAWTYVANVTPAEIRTAAAD